MQSAPIHACESQEPITIADIFGPARIVQFIEDYLHRLPYALAGTTNALCGWGAWETLDAVWAAGTAEVLVIRKGEQLLDNIPRTSGNLRTVLNDGYTVRIRHAEHHHPMLLALAEIFAATFEAPVDIHVYATPPNSFGFSWHYDAEDVFIIQTAGEKEYFLRKNTVNPWPLEEAIPADMRYEREIMPLMRVVMHTGDLLYIPCGYWHRAQVPVGSDVAISLAIGVMSRSAISIVDTLRKHLLRSLLWRQRLPVTNHLPVAEAEAAYARLLGELAKDLTKELANPALIKELLTESRPGERPERVADADHTAKGSSTSTLAEIRSHVG
jgi:50S ribosomal protein L16 3-hydroxylase